MQDYIEKITPDFLEELGVAKTSAAEHIFKVDEYAEKLGEDQAQVFHTIVAKCLFLCKRARPDIQVVVAFLATRVSEPDVDDWKN